MQKKRRSGTSVEDEIAHLRGLDLKGLQARWRSVFQRQTPLNVLLSFAKFEREVTSERIRDKIAASKRKGLWVGGTLPLGYEMKDGKIADDCGASGPH